MPQNNKTKKLWCKTADIPQNTLFMMGPPIKGFFDIWPKKGLGNKLTNYFTLFNGDFSSMCYLRDEFDAQAKFLADKMLANPKWAIRFMDKVYWWSTEFFKLSKEQGKYKLRNLTDKELIKVYRIPYKGHLYSHVLGSSLSWHADADKERVTKAIILEIKSAIEKNNIDLVPGVVFSTLSTPTNQSILEQEEIAFLKIAEIINSKKKVKKVFIYSGLKSLVKELEKVDNKIYKLIIRHFKKYDWIPYQYKGPAYTIEDFLARWQALFREKSDPSRLLNQIKKKRIDLKKEQKDLYTKIAFNNRQKDLIKMAQSMVALKEYRKMALYHGMYYYDKVFFEIALRLGLWVDQVRAMNYWEIPEALLNKKYNVDELNARLKECVAAYDGKKYTVYTGKAFKEYLKDKKFEKVKIDKSGKFVGSCASPGKVKGTVKIINLPEEMRKMKQGNILVAHNTNPNLVPAMKKAKAIISEAGGLTCHTAIVARELKIPCVVGVPLADKILKDGDQVEVDASNGIVKKIK